MKQWPIYLGVAVLAAAAGGMVTTCQAEQQANDLVARSEAKNGEAGLVGQRRPDWTVPGLDGEALSAADFDDQVVLVNFWATWCVPCRAEMPMLAQLQKDYRDRGLAIVGIALDEVDQAAGFVDSLDIDYAIAVGQAEVMAMNRDYGNLAGMLPYSVLIGRDGVVRWTKLGEVHREELEAQIEPLL